ncbi:MAG TPA: phosphoglycerate dehydrogenase, partial [Armatimonadetes bacterium]|nr:phosphoglycerate dehydrogenase [Armatimonadota bacterium]
TGMDKSELISIIGNYDALAVRSETKVTADVLEAATKLKIIGRAGVGVDNIDVPLATQKGILVVNSPAGNTIAAAELTMAMMLSLSRNIPQGHNSLRAGEWKRSKFVG